MIIALKLYLCLTFLRLYMYNSDYSYLCELPYDQLYKTMMCSLNLRNHLHIDFLINTKLCSTINFNLDNPFFTKEDLFSILFHVLETSTKEQLVKVNPLVKLILEQEYFLSNQKDYLSQVFQKACNYNNVEIASFIYYDIFPQQIVISSIQLEEALSFACNMNNIDVVKFILSTPNFKENTIIHINDSIFKGIVLNLSIARGIQKEQNEAVISYFILDYGIEETDNIKNFLKKIENGHSFSSKLFQTRKLNNDLHHNEESKTYKHKI